MILVNVKMAIKPDYADRWPEIVREFTASTRAESGNKWIEWSRSVEDPNTYVLLEAFSDEGAGDHVRSAHFQQMLDDYPEYLTATPMIVSQRVPDGPGWEPMSEMHVD